MRAEPPPTGAAEGSPTLADDARPAEPFEKQRLARPDGRYVILYTFSDDAPHPEGAPGADAGERAGAEAGEARDE